ncbi:MAG: response regulator [Gammaproteobacteria bacterium]|nr:response regulator [Gammaproteobacteria bacterium]
MFSTKEINLLPSPLMNHKEEAKNANNDNNNFSEWDNLSHAIRTPLHVLGGYVANLEKFSQKFSQVKISDPTALQKNLFRRSTRLERYLSTIQAQARLLADGDYSEFFRQIQLSSKKSDKPDDSSIVIFKETLASLTNHINHLQATQEKLKMLVHNYEILKIEELKNQFDEITREIKTLVIQIKRERDDLNRTISPAVSSPAHIPLCERKKENNFQRLRVLIVDDMPVNQRILKRMLGKQHCCEFANNGKEAVEKYSENHFDIIFMDIQMPVMDGLEATREIRQEELARTKRRTPIIASTAIDSATLDKGITVAAGMDGYIMKPYDEKRVHEIIHLHMNRAEEVCSDSESDMDNRPSTPTFPIKKISRHDFPPRTAASWSTPSDGQRLLTKFHLLGQGKRNKVTQDLLAKSSDITITPRPLPLLRSFL